MERRLKERLIGAAVLALAAVIFIPMILDNTSRRERAITETNIPGRPDEDFSSRVVPAQAASPAQPAGGAEQPAAVPPQQAADSETAPPRQEEKTAAVPPPAKPEAPAGKEAPVGQGTPARQEAPSTTAQADRGKAQPAPPAKSETTSAPAANGGSAVPVEEKSATAPARRDLQEWVVQIGSFSSKDNADRLIKKLRDGGYHAFVETATQDAQTVYRVRVGPELRRSRAEALKDRLTQDLKMKGMLVMRYP